MGVVLNWNSVYPTSIDDQITNFPTVTDTVHDVMASHVNELAQAVVALETASGGFRTNSVADPLSPSNGEVLTYNSGSGEWEAATPAAGGSLQDAYEVLNTIAVTTAEGTVSLSNSADVTDLLTLSRTFTSTGNAISVSMDAGTTGVGVSIADAGNGTGLFINKTGTTGVALRVQDGGASVFVISNTGSIANTPTSGTNFTVDTLGAGNISLDSAAASNFTVSGATADLTLGARGATVTLNESGETTLDTTATSIVGAINELVTAGAAADLQTAYDIGQTIDIDSSDAAVSISAQDIDHTANLLELNRSPVSGSIAGNALDVTLGGFSSGDGVNITDAGDGDSLFIDKTGTAGVAMRVQDGGGSVFVISNTGSIACTPTSGTNFTVDATGAGSFSLDSAAASNVSVTDAELQLSTITSGELDITSAGLMDVNAGANLDIDVAGTYNMLATSTFDISGTGTSFLRTLTTGDIRLEGAAPAAGSALSAGAVVAGTGQGAAAGSGNDATNGGLLWLAGGNGGASDGTNTAAVGGRIQAFSGDGGAGSGTVAPSIGGAFIVTTGDGGAAGATTNGANAGAITLTAGAGSAASSGVGGTGGLISLLGGVGGLGVGGAGGAGSSVVITAGDGGNGSTGGNGGDITLTAGDPGTGGSPSAGDITFDALAMTTPITLNETGDLDLSGFTATSIIGALNEALAAGTAIDLDDAYTNGNIINVVGGSGTVRISNSAGVTDCLTIARSNGAGGVGIQVDMGLAAEAQTGHGIAVEMGTATTGDALNVIQDAGRALFIDADNSRTGGTASIYIEDSGINDNVQIFPATITFTEDNALSFTIDATPVNPGIQFEGGQTSFYIGTAAVSAGVTATEFVLQAGVGGAASGADAKAGAELFLEGGYGGNGDATWAAGAGGHTWISGSGAGTAAAGGGDNGGSTYIEVGAGSGAGVNGSILIGTGATPAGKSAKPDPVAITIGTAATTTVTWDDVRSSRITGDVQITTSTATNIWTHATTSEELYYLTVYAVGKQSTTVNAYATTLKACFKNDGGTLTQIGSDTLVGEFDGASAAYSVFTDISSTTIRVQVQQTGSDTVDWTVRGELEIRG
jgi:hypothetical protein